MRKLVILLLLSFNGLWAQVQFETKASKQTLGINERLRIDFVMNGDGDNFSPPNFEGFRIVAGPSQQISQSWINGRSSFNKTYSYYLLPLQRGTLTIRQASIEINGQTYKTAPLRINVTAAVEQPRDPNDIQVDANNLLHLVADVSKTNPYINEPITVVYKLYFSYNIGISNWRELDKPKYNDFWSQNIDIKQLKVEEGNYNGEKFRYVILRKTVLYPQKSGKLEIEPLSLDIDVELPSNKRTIFGQMVAIQDNKRVSAGAKSINVRSLPEAGKPADFSGAVGKFDFNVKASTVNIKNGESLELKVSVGGSGNMKLFSLPKPVVPAALEMYDPVRKENVTTTLSGMSGNITDNYTIIPQFKGKYAIQPMRFSYFDVAAGTYKTIMSPEIIINVLDGPMAAGTAGSESNTPAKMKVEASEQLKFIKLKTSLESISKKDFFNSAIFYVLLLLPFLCIPILIFFRKKQQAVDNDVAGNRIRTNNRLARKYLSEAKLHLENKELFYISLEKAMHNFLKAKLHIETSEMSKDKIKVLLHSRNAKAATITEFISLAENCEFARYAPSSAVAIQQDYTRAVAVISDLEKQL